MLRISVLLFRLLSVLQLNKWLLQNKRLCFKSDVQARYHLTKHLNSKYKFKNASTLPSLFWTCSFSLNSLLKHNKSTGIHRWNIQLASNPRYYRVRYGLRENLFLPTFSEWAKGWTSWQRWIGIAANLVNGTKFSHVCGCGCTESSGDTWQLLNDT